jgi:hypothetical protein
VREDRRSLARNWRALPPLQDAAIRNLLCESVASTGGRAWLLLLLLLLLLAGCSSSWHAAAPFFLTAAL